MDLKVISRTDGKLKLHIRDTNLAFVNALRREIIGSLEALAIDEVEFLENTSSMFNEYLANRLAMIPLTYEDSQLKDLKVTLSLNAEGPCMVYSRDLKSSDEKIRVYNENIPLIKLGPNQKLKFEAIAIMGKGREHAKFQSALASFTSFPEVKKTKSLTKAEMEAARKAAPNLIDADGKLIDPYSADLDNAIADASNGNIYLAGKEDEFIFFVESYNNITAEKHFLRAIESLKVKLSELREDKLLK